VGGEVVWGLGHAGADDEPQPGFVQGFQVRRGQHASVGDDDEVAEAVPGLESLDDRQDRQGLGLVALEAADLQREPVPVDQQPDDDLGVDPAFLGIADLAQVVFLLHLEVQRGDVVQAQADVTDDGRVSQTRRGDLTPVVPLPGAGQRAAHRLLTGRPLSQVGQHPPSRHSADRHRP
jgi:hypothetical protein